MAESSQQPSQRVISTSRAPAAIGPYSQAVASGGLLFCSGQIALDPNTGELVGPAEVQIQCRQAMENLRAVLAAAGVSFADVLKTTLFLIDMADFQAVNEIYATYFDGEAPPARATVAVAALPKGARFEIEAIARVPDQDDRKHQVDHDHDTDPHTHLPP